MNLWWRLLLLRWTSPRRPKVEVVGPCVSPFRVAPTDLDLLRHVNNGRYLTLLDLARVDLLVRSGVADVLERNGWYPVVTAETIAFHRSLRVWEPFTVTTVVLGWDERTITLEQTFRRSHAGDGEVVAQAVVRALFLRRSGGRVPMAELMSAAGHHGVSPALPGWVASWQQAQQAQQDLRSPRTAG